MLLVLWCEGCISRIVPSLSNICNEPTVLVGRRRSFMEDDLVISMRLSRWTRKIVCQISPALEGLGFLGCSQINTATRLPIHCNTASFMGHSLVWNSGVTFFELFVVRCCERCLLFLGVHIWCRVRLHLAARPLQVSI